MTEEKPATAAVNGLGSKSLNRYIIQVLNTFLAFRNTGLEAGILRRRVAWIWTALYTLRRPPSLRSGYRLAAGRVGLTLLSNVETRMGRLRPIVRRVTVPPSSTVPIDEPTRMPFWPFYFPMLITSAPAITNIANPATNDVTPVHPFANINIADNPHLPGGAKDSATIKVTGGGTLSGAGLTAVDAHTYTVAASDPASLGKLLQSVLYTPERLPSGQSALIRFELDVTNNLPTPLTTQDTNTTVLVAGTGMPPPSSPSMDMVHPVG